MIRKLVLAAAALASVAAPLAVAGTADASTYKPRIVCVKHPYPSCGWSG